jgi:uncharacterized membrane protein
MTIASNWFIWALFSAVFAALTAIFAKMAWPVWTPILRRSSGRW